MNQVVTPRWHAMRTDETREVERVLRTQFQNADAYRYNSASIRVRVVDDRFAGKSREQRDEMVEPLFEQLPPATQADIMNLLTLTPEERDDPSALRAQLANAEFEDPSDSGL